MILLFIGYSILSLVASNIFFVLRNVYTLILELFCDKFFTNFCKITFLLEFTFILIMIKTLIGEAK